MFPILFQVYGYEVQSYPMLIFFGVIISALYFSRLCFRRKLMLNFFSDNLILLLLSFILFARLGGILKSLYAYIEDPIRIVYIFDGNMNYSLALFGFMLVFCILAFLKKEGFWKWFDVLAESFLPLAMFVSVADFLAGKNYGIPTSLPWAVSFNIPEVRYTIPVHPTQLYELGALIILFLFIQIVKRKTSYDGVVAAYVFLLFYLVKAILSLIHGAPEILLFKIPLSLVISLVSASIFLIILIFRTHPNIHFLQHHN